MIRVDLVDNTARVKHVSFRVVPVTAENHFVCSSDGMLPLRSAVRISRKLKAGRTFGQIGKYVWYRVAGAPAGRPKRLLASHR